MYRPFLKAIGSFPITVIGKLSEYQDERAFSLHPLVLLKDVKTLNGIFISDHLWVEGFAPVELFGKEVQFKAVARRYGNDEYSVKAIEAIG